MAFFGANIQAPAQERAKNSDEDEQKARLILSPFQNKKLKIFELSGLRSAIVRVAAKQQEYQLVLKSKDQVVTADYKVLVLKISQKERNWSVTALIKNSKDNKLVKRVQATDVKREEILAKGELALEVLFGLKAASALDPKPDPKTVTARANAKIPNAPAPGPAPELIDFKKRIIGIKQDLPQKIEAEKKAISESKERQKSKKEKKTKKSASSPSKKKPRRNSPEAPAPLRKAPENWELDYLASLSYQARSMEALDSRNGYAQLSIATDLTYLTLEAQVSARHVRVPAVVYSASLWLRTPNAPSEKLDAPFERATDYQAGVSVKLWETPLAFLAGAGMRSLQFASLPDQGAGLKPSSLRHLFVEAGFAVDIYKDEVKLKAVSRSALSFTNESEHEIDTSGFEYSGLLLELQAKNHFYLENSFFYARFLQEEFSNKSDLTASAQAYTLGFAKRF